MRPILQTGLRSQPPGINRSPPFLKEQDIFLFQSAYLFLRETQNPLRRFLFRQSPNVACFDPIDSVSYLSVFFPLPTKIPLKYLQTPNTAEGQDAAPVSFSMQTQLPAPNIVSQAEKRKLRKRFVFLSCFLNRSIEISRITVPPSLQQAESPSI